MMHQGFCDSDDKVSYKYYCRKIEKLNISFVKLGEKECERSPLQDKHLEEIHGLMEAYCIAQWNICSNWRIYEGNGGELHELTRV